MPSSATASPTRASSVTPSHPARRSQSSTKPNASPAHSEPARGRDPLPPHLGRAQGAGLPKDSSRLLPGALEPVDHRDDPLVKRRGDVVLGTEPHDAAVERLDLGGTLGQSILQHARAVFV